MQMASKLEVAGLEKTRAVLPRRGAGKRSSVLLGERMTVRTRSVFLGSVGSLPYVLHLN